MVSAAHTQKSYLSTSPWVCLSAFLHSFIHFYSFILFFCISACLYLNLCAVSLSICLVSTTNDVYLCYQQLALGKWLVVVAGTAVAFLLVRRKNNGVLNSTSAWNKQWNFNNHYDCRICKPGDHKPRLDQAITEFPLEELRAIKIASTTIIDHWSPL